MTTLNFLSPSLPDRVTTTAGDDSQGAPPAESDRSGNERWRQVTKALLEWQNDPGELDDEGITPPSREIIQQAVLLAQTLNDQELPPPDAVVPDPDGGILFEWRGENSSEVCHIWDDATIEYRRFEGTQLVERRRLN